MNSFWLPLRPARLSLAPGRFTGKINMGIRKQECGSHGNPEMDGLAPQGNSGSTAVLTAGRPQQPLRGPGSTSAAPDPTHQALALRSSHLSSICLLLADTSLCPSCLWLLLPASLWLCGPWSFPRIFSMTYIQPFHRERTWYFHLITIYPIMPSSSSTSSCQPLASLQMSTLSSDPSTKMRWVAHRIWEGQFLQTEFCEGL